MTSQKEKTAQRSTDEKVFEQIRILSLDASRLYACTTQDKSFSVRKDTGVYDCSKFEGCLDASLETIKLEDVFNTYRRNHGVFQERFKFYPRNDNSMPYSLALINVKFEYTIKDYANQKTSYGTCYYLQGRDLEDVLENVKDHVWIEGGTLVAIEVPFSKGKQSKKTDDKKSKKDANNEYLPVENPISTDLLGYYFVYDDEKKCYQIATELTTDGQEKNVSFTTQTDSKTIREKLYKDGFWCDGVKYVRYKRSAGSSREGSCLFIPQVLWGEMMDWSRCGIDETKPGLDQASFQAYIALTLSSIKQTITLNKKNILIIPDQESTFLTKAVRVFTKIQKKGKKDVTTLDAKEDDNVEVKNKIWDGEALLDESVFMENGLGAKGMMLLRNRFFKTCAFNTKLQKWFADHHITKISQLNGFYRHGAKLADIKMVITESSLKYCKMFPTDKSPEAKKVSLEEKYHLWLDNAFDGNTSAFGLVKTEKNSDIMDGEMVMSNYQLLNTVGMTLQEASSLLIPSFDLLDKMSSIPMFLQYYVEQFYGRDEDDDNGDNAQNDEVNTRNYRAKTVTEMLKRNTDFMQTKFFRDYRGDMISHFKGKLKMGRMPIDGTYATLFGNGAEFLQAVIDKNYVVDEPLALKDNEIRTTRFSYETELLCERSPHITMGNLFLAKNVDNDVYKNYFNFEEAPAIVCVNAIRHNIQHRLNGCDYDSDTMLITDNAILLAAAKRDAEWFPVPVFTEDDAGPVQKDEDAPVQKKTDGPTYNPRKPSDMVKLDCAIANNKVGEIVNLSQFLNSVYWDEIAQGKTHDDCKDLYADICKLAVLSGIEIDKAKRANNVSAGTVLAEVRTRKASKLNPTGNTDKKNKLSPPRFFTYMTGAALKTATINGEPDVTEEEKKEQKKELTLSAPMSFIFDAVNEKSSQASSREQYMPLQSFVHLNKKDTGNNDCHYRDNVVEAARAAQTKIAECNRKCNNPMHKKDSSEIISLQKEMEKSFANALKIASDNVQNEHILSLLIHDLDPQKDPKNKDKPPVYKLSDCYALLIAVLVFEKNHRFLDRMIRKTTPQYELKHVNDDTPDANISIYGHSHIKLEIS